MTALIVVESMFGNTRAIADRVAASLETVLPVQVVDVAGAPHELPDGTTLLVVGAPTHAFGMSREASRVEAVNRGATAVVQVGIREWLGSIAGLTPGLQVAAFDTRVRRVGLKGSAAKAAARRLRHDGCDLIVEPMSFWVDGTPGPLLAGESQRAEAWGAELGRLLQQGHPAHP